MLNIYTDVDKLKIFVDYKNLKTFPYGSGQLVYGINDLSINTETELIKFSSSRTGGEQFYVWLNELQFNGVQATKVNVNRLFQETCFSCCSNGGGGGGGSVDTKDIVDALDRINETLKKEYPPTPSGDCCDKLWFEEYVKKDEPIEQDPSTKYMIYEEDEDCCDLFWTEDYLKSEEFAELYPDEKTKYMIYVEDGEPSPIFPSYSSKTETNTDCEGYDLYRYTYITTYVSYDNGITWEEYKKVLSSKELIESECPICGHLPDPIYSSTTRTYEGCEGYDYYKYTEIKYYSGYSTADLVQYGMNTNKELIEKNSSHCGFNPQPTGTIFYHADGTTQRVNPYYETWEYSSYKDKYMFSYGQVLDIIATSATVDSRVQILENSDANHSGAFSNCSNLESVFLPDGLEIIGTYAFERCTKLTSVNIPDTVKSIYVNAFAWCESLTSLTIPSSVNHISAGVFAFSGLTELKYLGSKEQWNNITLSQYWKAESNITKIICNDGIINL